MQRKETTTVAALAHLTRWPASLGNERKEGPILPDLQLSLPGVEAAEP
jgi:hypothetical protein